MSLIYDNKIADMLEPCGLPGNEGRILAFLLTHGPSPAGVLAKRVGLKRPTTYVTLSTLVDSGFVTRKVRRGVWYFHPMPVEYITQSLRGSNAAQTGST